MKAIIISLSVSVIVMLLIVGAGYLITTYPWGAGVVVVGFAGGFVFIMVYAAIH